MSLSTVRFKTCTKCGCTKPATREFFYLRRRVEPCCVCLRAQKAAYRASHRKELSARETARYWSNHEEERAKRNARREANKDRLNAEARERYHQDPEASRQKARDSYQRNREAIRAGQKRYYEENREKLKEAIKDYYEANREKILAYQRQYQQENSERLEEYRKAYFKRWYSVEENRQRMLERSKRWREEHPEKNAAKQRNRLARIKAAEGSHTAEEVLAIGEGQGWLCFYCLTPTEEDYHVDHMTPISRGGSNSMENLAIACPSCNISKSTKTAEEFLECLRVEEAV